MRTDPDLTFFTAPLEHSVLLATLRKRHRPFRTVIAGEIQRGVSPDVAAAHVVTEEEAVVAGLERGLLRKSTSGVQIKRFESVESDQLLIYTTPDTRITDYPRVAGYLRKFRSRNTCKEVTQGKHPYWSLHRSRDPNIFRSPKFIGLTTAKRPEVIFDESDGLFVTDAMYVFCLEAGEDPWTCLGIINSRLFEFLYRVANEGESRVIPQVKAAKLYGLPYPSAAPHTEFQVHVRRLVELHRQSRQAETQPEQAMLARAIQAEDDALDDLVYGTYGLSASEIEVVKTSGEVPESDMTVLYEVVSEPVPIAADAPDVPDSEE